MSENLFARIGRLVSASANSLVDAVETSMPEQVMEETIREVDQAIFDVKAELGRQEAQRHLTAQQLAAEHEEQSRLVGQIELAIKQQRSDLAVAGVARQLDIEAQLPVLNRTLEDQHQQIEELGGYVQALQAKKREMEQALAEWRKSQAAGVAAADNAVVSDSPACRVARAEAGFNRVMQKQNPAYSAGNSDQRLAELEELSRENRIRERLAEIQAKMDD